MAARSLIAAAAFLVWVRAFGRLHPQKMPDAGKGAPFIDEGIRGRVVGSPITLPADQAGLSLAELAKLHPAPPLPAE